MVYALTLLGVTDEIFVRSFRRKRDALHWLFKEGFLKKVIGGFENADTMPKGFKGYRIDED